MNAKEYMMVCLLGLLVLGGCEESYQMEISVPLLGTPATRPSELKAAADPLDVQIEVEKIAGAAGLLPYAENTEEDDLFSAATDIIDTPSANTRTWKHPAYPLFLSMTRNAGEFVLLVNYVPEAKPDTEAVKLYKSLKEQLSQLPVKLLPSSTGF